MVMRRLKLGSRSKAPSPAPAAAEFEFAAKGLLSDLILHSFNVTNLIIKPRLLMAWIKVGNVTRPGQPITGRAQVLCSSSARGARAGLGWPTAGHGWAISSLRQLASLPPRHGTLSLKGFGPGVRDCTCPALPRLRASVGHLSVRPSEGLTGSAPHALAPLAAAAARPSLIRAGLLSVSGLTRNGCLNSTTELLELRD
jgi:hypothetical protein